MSARPVATALVALLLVSACAGDDAVATATAACAAPERPPLQEGSHLIGDTAPPVPYSSNPPTSGWHASGAWAPPGVYETALPAPELVSVLEQGGVAVVHRDPLDAAELATAVGLVDEVDGLLVTPHPLAEQDPPFALVAWGVLQRCDALVADDVATFARAHGGTDLEP